MQKIEWLKPDLYNGYYLYEGRLIENIRFSIRERFGRIIVHMEDNPIAVMNVPICTDYLFKGITPKILDEVLILAHLTR